MDIALRAAFLFFLILLVIRASGRRELSGIGPLDLVMLIVLGDLIQQGITQGDYSVTGAAIAVGTIASLQVAASYLSFRSRRARTLLEGDPIVVVQDGRVLEQNLHRERMTRDELAGEMRLQQIGSFDEVAGGSSSRTATSAS